MNILLVDDDEDDHLFFKYAIEAAGHLDCRVSSLYNGRQALQFLIREGIYYGTDQMLPDLIILDINMPLMDGISLLKIIKSNSRLRHIPVVMLTTSSTQEEKAKCDALGCNGFYSKPASIVCLSELITDIVTEHLVPWTT